MWTMDKGGWQPVIPPSIQQNEEALAQALNIIWDDIQEAYEDSCAEHGHPQRGRPVPAAQRRRNSHGGFHAHARLVTLLLAQGGG